MKAQWIEADYGDGQLLDVWIDPSTGLPLRIEYLEGGTSIAYELSDFVSMGEKKYPGSIRVLLGEHSPFQLGNDAIEVMHLEEQLKPPIAELPAMPPDALVFSHDSCAAAGMQPLRKIKAAPPMYPYQSRMQHQMGMVVLGVIIAPDGAVSQIAVLQSAGTDFDQATIEAVRGWRYEPVVCNGKPVEVETTITVNYSLGG